MRLARPSPTGRLLTPAFLLVTVATCLYFLSIGMALPVLPRYVAGPLAGSNLAVGIVAGAFGLSAVLMRPLAGRLSDRRGRRPMVVIGAATVAASVLAYRLVDAVSPLIVLRLLNGAGEALFFVGAASVVNDLSPDGRRGEAFSIFSLAVFTGLGAGPVIGEAILGAGGYARVWDLAALGALVTALLGLGLPDTRPDANAPPGPLIHRAALVPGLLLASSVWGLAGFTTFVPLYALRLGLTGAGLVLATYSGIILAIRSFGARIPDRFGPRRTATVSLAWSAIGLGVVAAWPAASGLFTGAGILAIGQSLAFPALMTLAVEGAPPTERGSVVATFTSFFDLSFGLGSATLGGIASALGYVGVFVGGALVAALGFVAMVWSNRRAALTSAGAGPGR
ncbi:MAG: MFS transporter [Actinomycetota bacterium]